MALAGNEIAAANQRRRDEELSKSRVGGVLESGVALAAPAVVLGTSLIATGAAGIAIAGSVVAGFGIAEWFRKLGSSKVNENLETLGQATEEALNRVESVLNERGAAIDEFKRRIESDEFRNAMASASLQALRTTQKERLKRLALILACGVKDNYLESESLDDMMRAAAELSERDISLLKELYQHPSPMDMNEIDRGRPDAVERMGSIAKLQAVAFVQLRTPGLDMGANIVVLLPEGKRFYERLQELAEQK
jgi:hypothetical protein